MSESSQDAIDKINQLASQPANTQANADLAEGAAAMVNGSQTMLTQAQTGTLKFDPETGESLIRVLNNQLETLHQLGENIGRISRESKLGMTPGGQVMSKFNQDVAESGPKAFVPAHDQFVRTLETAVQAIQLAVDNYLKTDENNAIDFKAKD